MIEKIKCNICKSEKNITVSSNFRINKMSGAIIGMKCPFSECASNKPNFNNPFFGIHVKRKLNTITKERIEYIFDNHNWIKILGINSMKTKNGKIKIIKTRYDMYLPLIIKPRKKKINKKGKEILLPDENKMYFGLPSEAAGLLSVSALENKLIIEAWLNRLDPLKKGICYLFNKGYTRKETIRILKINEKKLYRENKKIDESYPENLNKILTNDLK